ncbi:MAG: hypothetical protein K6A33_12175 [Clostridiales bacterium]|jgi:hypothetical protein|nr:hypothetical protein [Clostridiales bacterium]
MAKRYWEKTYSFTSHYDVPFRYVCGHCGKEVSGVRKVERTYQYSKTAPFDRWSRDQGRNNQILALTEAEGKEGDAKAEALLKKELAFYKTEVGKGHYDVFLKQHTKCPFCQNVQRWAYPLKKCWIEILFGAAATPLGAYLLYRLIAALRGTAALDDTTFPLLIIGGAMFLVLGPCALVTGILELRKRNAMKDQPEQLPEVRFPD